ncbi:MAG: DUF1080 domain-containing protein [Bacteroidia bacterium]|nr:DUF1080 domain-containing protein [Bacteroidia bacterium]
MKNRNLKMKSENHIIFGLFLLPFALFNLTASSQNNKGKNVNEKTQVVLFDGTSTDAWKDIKSDHFPENGWVVKEEVLTVEATTADHEGGHDIVTKEQFSNFELELEVRLSEGANSGVKYMVIDSYAGKKGQYLGLEYQLIDNEKHPDALLGRDGNRKMATLYDIFPASEIIRINPPGTWNKVKILVNGNHVEHWLNDLKVLEFDRNSDNFKELVRLSKYNTLENFGGQKQGHILLQGHGNEVSFRNIRITTW